jgi:hypothetical protein
MMCGEGTAIVNLPESNSKQIMPVAVAIGMTPLASLIILSCKKLGCVSQIISM